MHLSKYNHDNTKNFIKVTPFLIEEVHTTFANSLIDEKKYFAKGLYVLADFEPQSNENADFSFMAVRGYGYDRITRISGAVDREMVFLF